MTTWPLFPLTGKRIQAKWDGAINQHILFWKHEWFPDRQVRGSLVLFEHEQLPAACFVDATGVWYQLSPEVFDFDPVPAKWYRGSLLRVIIQRSKDQTQWEVQCVDAWALAGKWFDPTSMCWGQRLSRIAMAMAQGSAVGGTVLAFDEGSPPEWASHCLESSRWKWCMPRLLPLYPSDVSQDVEPDRHWLVQSLDFLEFWTPWSFALLRLPEQEMLPDKILRSRVVDASVELQTLLDPNQIKIIDRDDLRRHGILYHEELPKAFVPYRVLWRSPSWDRWTFGRGAIENSAPVWEEWQL